MIIENINPDNRSISDVTLSKNKIFVSSTDFKKSSLENSNFQEWFPVYLPDGYSQESAKVCMDALIFLFFGMGNM